MKETDFITFPGLYGYTVLDFSDIKKNRNILSNLHELKTNKETNDPLQTMCLYCLLFDLFKFYVINFSSQKNVNISFNQWILPYSLETLILI